jgi:hypothetical protein
VLTKKSIFFTRNLPGKHEATVAEEDPSSGSRRQLIDALGGGSRTVSTTLPANASEAIAQQDNHAKPDEGRRRKKNGQA